MTKYILYFLMNLSFGSMAADGSDMIANGFLPFSADVASEACLDNPEMTGYLAYMANMALDYGGAFVDEIMDYSPELPIIIAATMFVLLHPHDGGMHPDNIR
jgi:hypothetical protein